MRGPPRALRVRIPAPARRTFRLPSHVLSPATPPAACVSVLVHLRRVFGADVGANAAFHLRDGMAGALTNASLHLSDSMTNSSFQLRDGMAGALTNASLHLSDGMTNASLTLDLGSGFERVALIISCAAVIITLLLIRAASSRAAYLPPTAPPAYQLWSY